MSGRSGLSSRSFRRLDRKRRIAAWCLDNLGEPLHHLPAYSPGIRPGQHRATVLTNKKEYDWVQVVGDDYLLTPVRPFCPRGTTFHQHVSFWGFFLKWRHTFRQPHCDITPQRPLAYFPAVSPPSPLCTARSSRILSPCRRIISAGNLSQSKLYPSMASTFCQCLALSP